MARFPNRYIIMPAVMRMSPAFRAAPRPLASPRVDVENVQPGMPAAVAQTPKKPAEAAVTAATTPPHPAPPRTASPQPGSSTSQQPAYPQPGSYTTCAACGNVVDRFYHCADCEERFALCVSCCAAIYLGPQKGNTEALSKLRAPASHSIAEHVMVHVVPP